MDPAVQERVDVLAEKANEGLLTEPERAEYEAYINTDDFISILKLKARRYLASSGVATAVPGAGAARGVSDNED